MKIIMMDMDGACANSNYYIKKWISSKTDQLYNQGYYGNELTYQIRNSYRQEFCQSTQLIFPIFAKRMTQIIKQTNAKIVISSDWRQLSKYNRIGNMKLMFNRRGMPGDSIIGYTPCYKYDNFYSSIRGQEIAYWINNNTYGNIEKCAIIDDRKDAYCDLPCCKFFQTSVEHGLTESIKNKVIQYLNS